MTTSTNSNPILAAPSKKLLLDDYVKKVISGDILASKKVKMACQRHLNDLERAGTKDFPYTFDEEKGHRPIRFIEKFCKPSKGEFNKLILLPWQHFVIGSLYGWVHKETGLRRFNEGLIFVARKNGKSAIVSGLSVYAASKDGENGADIYILANSMKQARKTIYEECRKMIRSSPELASRFRSLRDAVYFDKTNSTIEPQASDSQKLDGLNSHLGLFDEIHEYKNYKLINIIKDSTTARRQPLTLYITTAGYVLDGPLMDYYERGADVLEGVIEDDRTFYFMAELDPEDDIEKPENWVKANPSMGHIFTLDTIRDEWQKNKDIPEQRTSFITKKLNVFVQADEQSFVTFEVIKRNSGHIDPETMTGSLCVGGYDLSDSEDFTSACLEFPLTGGGVYVLSHSFVPEAKVKRDREDIPYQQWQSEGLLTICPGEYIEKEIVFDWFTKNAQKYSVAAIAYDPARAYRLNKDLEAYGGEEWTLPVRQGALTLMPALDDIKELLLAGKVVYNNNRLFRWYLNNVRLGPPDRNNNRLPTKQHNYRKIDGFAAWLNAHTKVMEFMERPEERKDAKISFMSAKQLRESGGND